MVKKQNIFELGARERQILEIVYRLGEASVKQVQEELPDRLNYSSVRTMLRLLAQKNILTFRQEGKRYLYKATDPKEKAQRSTLKNVLVNFFAGNVPDTMAALLDVAGDNLCEEDFVRMQSLIHQARKENR